MKGQPTSNALLIPRSILCKLILLACVLYTNLAYSQVSDTLFSAVALKKLSLEELMNIEVTSVTKRPEKLFEVASAIQVITQEDIHNAGYNTLAEVLRLAGNLQVAQVNSSQWAISARGFNNVLANKLLVLLDGRIVYTPLYAGVFWDVQNVLLEDVDRIEVISGPGGTLWGGNAVNGVINIITKNTKDTKGFFAEAATGSQMPIGGSLRYGGNINPNLTYRVFGTGFKMDNTPNADNSKSNDEWSLLKGGFRMDWDISSKNKLSVLGNIYDGRPNPDGGDTAVVAKGDNILARWNHNFSDKADIELQAYYDHTLRDFGNGFSEDLKNFDLDLNTHHHLGTRHEITYGIGFRAMAHKVTNLELFAFLPAHKTLYIYSGFVQDEIMLIRDRLRFTIGSKIEHNSYTGVEYQPSGRLAWNPGKNHTIWSAVSRAVRTPARIDRDFNLFIIPNLALISGNKEFESESMIAYELGWRTQPVDEVSISLSTFYNVYDKVRSAAPGPAPLFIPITFDNGVKGHSYGFEASARARISSHWTLLGRYTFFKKRLKLKDGYTDANNATAESNDPKHQLLLQSSLTLPAGFQLGTVLRHVGKLPQPAVDAYTELDIRIGFQLHKNIELSIVAQNLLDKRHLEFIPTSPAPREIERSLYGKITCRF